MTLPWLIFSCRTRHTGRNSRRLSSGIARSSSCTVERASRVPAEKLDVSIKDSSVIKHTELAWDKENHRLFRLEGRKRGKAIMEARAGTVADSGRGRRAGRHRHILSCIQLSGSGRNLSPANQREPTGLETPRIDLATAQLVE